MPVHADKQPEKEGAESVGNHTTKGGKSGRYLTDNRPGNNPVQKKGNNTGLPDQLKSGVESLSGHAMDDVKVHYNSDKPAQLGALAYAQGTSIHVAPGQEKHLPHEAWHVAQQKQGRVKATRQLKKDVAINDDEDLEKEADLMGAHAMQLKANATALSDKQQANGAIGAVTQRAIEYTAPESAGAKEAKELAAEFVAFSKANSPVLGEIYAAAEALPNFNLSFKAISKPGGEGNYQGLTRIDIRTAAGEWKGLKDVTNEWSTLPKPTHAKMTIEFVFKPKKGDTERQFYILLHEMIIHAAEYWPLLKTMVDGTHDNKRPSDAFEEGGAMDQHAHHNRIVNRSYGPYEDLLKKAFGYILDQSIKEMLALEKEKKSFDNRKWHPDNFIDVHQEDIITQITTPLLNYTDEHFEEFESDYKDWTEIKDEAGIKSEARILVQSATRLIEHFQRAVEVLTHTLEQGWMQLGGVGKGGRYIGWSDHAEGLLTDSISLTEQLLTIAKSRLATLKSKLT